MKTCLVLDDSSVIRKVARRILEGLDSRSSHKDIVAAEIPGRKLDPVPDARVVRPTA
jgi:CheY-like chemotaxis protein